MNGKMSSFRVLHLRQSTEVIQMGTVFDIQRFSINDGPGFRTSVFLKGCPLNCLWCHNPESKSYKKEIFYKPEKCVLCGRCAQVCECHQIKEGKHIFQRDKCTNRMLCVNACLYDALDACGYEIEPTEVVDIVLHDKDFFAYSGGGVTYTGGEPLAQPNFLLELVKCSKEKGLHVCIETCGYAPYHQIEALIPYVDLFLYDIKETDSRKHIAYTGVDHELIMSNLVKLDSDNANIVLRCPIIPGYNDRDEHLTNIAMIANNLQHVLRIDVEAYHPLGQTKSAWLGIEYPLKDIEMPSTSDIDRWIACISKDTQTPVKMA